MSVAHIQKALQEQGLDGWLFYDFRGSDPLSYVILGMPRDVFRSRRWFYYVPATGKPVRMHVRGPSFYNLQAMSPMMENRLVADAVAIISTVDPIMGEVDR